MYSLVSFIAGAAFGYVLCNNPELAGHAADVLDAASEYLRDSMY